ncbi:hypothetical protein [Lysinibacillus parviboronicapiens]|uniref:hypothetical protein n=1 Tax=Lysinibacillus parviboronicapiens TaxID=436516 RepID=UPI000D3BF47B|nr:hypothetical protein [Lysinibacillus parviboronicapiens]
MNKWKNIAVFCLLSSLFLNSPNQANAAEETMIDNNGLEVIYDNELEIKELTPTEITDFPTNFNKQMENDYRIKTITDIVSEGNIPDLNNSKQARAVATGTISDYLSGTGDSKTYSININPGILLQAQMKQPSDSALDYDLYIFDSTGSVILDGSEHYTHLNSDGTLPEAVGVINTSNVAQTYYIYVHSSQGGSINESFILNYSISHPYDNFETDEHASKAKNFTYGNGGALLNSRNISSPIDNDWYVINVPSTRNYDKVNFSISSASVNGSKIEVYEDVSNGYMKMKKLLNGSGDISVNTGKYYIRVTYSGDINNFNASDLQNYTLSLTPIMKPENIVIKDYNSEQGMNDYPSGYYYGKHYRAKGFLDIIGYVTYKDKETGDIYGIPYTSVTGNYLNDAWSGTADNAVRTGVATTDNTGKFTVNLTLPPAVGAISQYITTSTHYYDYCDVYVYVTDKPSVEVVDNIYHFAYSMYGY